MSRTGAPSDFSADSLQPFLAVEALFDSGDVRLWGGYGDLTIDGEEYTGGGSLLNISGVQESGEISAQGASVVLSGLDASIISIALTENYQNRSCRIIIGTLNSDGQVGAFYTLFKGRIDTMTIEEGGDTASIAVSLENRLIDLERPRARRYTNEDQQSLYPGDTGFSYVNDIQDKTIDWGRPTNS